MKTNRLFLILTIVYLMGFFGHALILQKTVYGDGIYYYSWLRSVVVDHDINFANEYTHFGVTTPTTRIGLPGNKHPIGAPLFWLPWYAQAHTVIGGTGYELALQLLVGFVSVLAAISGLLLLYRLLAQSFSQTASVLATISIAAATNLLFYGSIDPINTHAISFFATTLFLSFLFSKNVSPFLTGCVLGFCSLVRPQDAALGILVLPSLKSLPAGKAGSHLFRLIAGAVLLFSPQLFVWYQLYGSPWTSPYLGMGELFAWWSPHFFLTSPLARLEKNIPS